MLLRSAPFLACSDDTEHVLFETEVRFTSEVVRIRTERAQEVIDFLLDFTRCAGVKHFRGVWAITLGSHPTSPWSAQFCGSLPTGQHSMKAAAEAKSGSLLVRSWGGLQNISRSWTL